MIRHRPKKRKRPQPGASCAGAVPSLRMRPSERDPSLRAPVHGDQGFRLKATTVSGG